MLVADVDWSTNTTYICISYIKWFSMICRRKKMNKTKKCAKKKSVRARNQMRRNEGVSVGLQMRGQAGTVASRIMLQLRGFGRSHMAL